MTRAVHRHHKFFRVPWRSLCNKGKIRRLLYAHGMLESAGPRLSRRYQKLILKEME